MEIHRQNAPKTRSAIRLSLYTVEKKERTKLNLPKTFKWSQDCGSRAWFDVAKWVKQWKTTAGSLLGQDMHCWRIWRSLDCVRLAVHLCLTFTSDARSQKTAPLNNHREDQLNNPGSEGEEACPVAPQKNVKSFCLRILDAWMPYSILCCLHGIQLHGIRTFFRLGWPSPQVEESGLKSKNLKIPRGDLGREKWWVSSQFQHDTS